MYILNSVEGVEVTPVRPEPSPIKLPENIEPDIDDTLLKSTILLEPDTTKEPVISALPFKLPSQSPVTPVRPEPSPT